MSSRDRLAVGVLLAIATVLVVALLAFASLACPTPGDIDPCPAWAINRGVVVTLAALAAGALIAPFAFLAELALRRRIVYRGAWVRAGRRAALVAALVAVLAGLRLGGALSVPILLFFATLAAGVEGFVTRQELAA
jgi:hypothetical protein